MRAAVTEPSMSELIDALRRHVGKDGAVPPGIATELLRENHWSGHLIDVLGVLTGDPRRKGYLAGRHFPDELATSLPIWAASPLSLEQVRLVVESGGWDPEPFVALANAALLETLLLGPDGSPRRIHGELAGAWVSDRLTLADADEVVRRVRDLLEEEQARNERRVSTGTAQRASGVRVRR